MAGKHDFTIYQGSTFEKQCTIFESDNSPVNLTGFTVRGKLKRRASDNTEIASFTCAVTNAAGGEFSFSMTAAETQALPIAPQSGAEKVFLNCAYDIEIVQGSFVKRILEGVASISPEVTK